MRAVHPKETGPWGSIPGSGARPTAEGKGSWRVKSGHACGSPRSCRSRRPMNTLDNGVFGADDLDSLEAFFRVNGYASLRGALDESLLAAAEADLVDAQEQLVAGALDARHAT